MIKKIISRIIKPSIKPAIKPAAKFLEIIKKPLLMPLDRFDKSEEAVKRNLLERKIVHLERMIKQMQKMNRPVKSEIKYRDKLKKNLENFNKKQKIAK